MADDDGIDYQGLVRGALQGVPRQVLRIAAAEGLPGGHALYLTFRTTHPGVALSPGLHARYPGEMTVVLEHQFWDLAVGEDAFSVTLRFGGARERLHVPFAALVAFADPGAEFGLRFEPVAEGATPVAAAAPGAGEGPATAGAAEPGSGNVVDIRAFRRPGRET
jgi:hypothetical protein